MIVYKVVRKSAPVESFYYTSAVIEEPKIRKYYVIGKWTYADARAADLGLGLLCFKTFTAALDFISATRFIKKHNVNSVGFDHRILECEALIELRLPPMRLYFKGMWGDDGLYPKTYDGIVGFYKRALSFSWTLPQQVREKKWYGRYKYNFETSWPEGTVSYFKIKPIKEVRE